MKHLIIGSKGEVGSALYQVLMYKHDISGIDKGEKVSGKFDFIHICFPYFRGFVGAVKKYKKKYGGVCVIHSTVPVGTSRKCGAVHSPIRGIHPHLKDSILIFKKYFGGEQSREAAQQFQESGVTCQRFNSPEETELAKLTDLLGYGWNIILQKEIKILCDIYGADFDNVYTEANMSYNAGYEKLGYPEFKKYILKHMPGGIGGHCLQMGARFINEMEGRNKFAEMVLSAGHALKDGENPLNNQDWLYCEYWGKRRTANDIARELGCSGVWVRKKMKDLGVPIRKQEFKKDELEKIIQGLDDGKTLVEIAEEFDETRTYDSIRNIVYKRLKGRSGYNPAIRDEETRQKISASLQGIPEDDWEGFIENENSLIRKSVAYKNWRKSVFERDGYTCQKCKKKGGIYLVAHHIEYFSKDDKKRFNLDNGITFCRECHLDFHRIYRKEGNREKLEEFLNKELTM